MLVLKANRISMNIVLLTLCVIHDSDRILLGLKKRGLGKGKWNGFGGKVEEGEVIEEAARREVKEEAGIEVVDLEKVGQLDFSWIEKPEKILRVVVFRSTHSIGEPTESEEMKPAWFSLDKIPYDAMWGDDRYWLPLLLEGKKFKGRFVFDDNDTILEYNLKENYIDLKS